MTALLRSLIPRTTRASFPRQSNLRSFSSTSVNSRGIDLNFTPKQLNALRSIAQHWQPEDAWCDGQALKLTRQDALSAYLVTLQNRCLPEPIHTLVNLTEYRNRTTADPRRATLQRHAQPASGENCVYISTIDLSSARDLASISRAIRRTTAMARSQELIRETYIMLHGARPHQIVGQLQLQQLQLHGLSTSPTAAPHGSTPVVPLARPRRPCQVEPPHYTQLVNEISGSTCSAFPLPPPLPPRRRWMGGPGMTPTRSYPCACRAR
ncbi:hypothetical protein B0H13DRAFT_2279340 [Mycena leptocephala]|nr:hypothetical protein B0H13DRAFT_2279340 [Mycena leptocephala]